MVKPVIHATKHYVQISLDTITAAAVNDYSIAVAVKVEDKNQVFEVEEGTVIKAIYVELWCRAGGTTASSGQMIIYKKQSDTTVPTTTEMAALGGWNNKRNIMYTTQGLFNDIDADALALFKGWIKIPKGKQRMGLGDAWKISVFAPLQDLQVCGFSTYKEYS